MDSTTAIVVTSQRGDAQPDERSRRSRCADDHHRRHTEPVACYAALVKLGVVGPDELPLIDAWAADLEGILGGR
jgi:hypothetical protein